MRYDHAVRSYFVYILASRENGTLYIGMTNNLVRRLREHREGKNDGFTKTYHVRRLVYYEESRYVLNAIEREKQLKKWRREWKIQLIQSVNPTWRDLGGEIGA